MQQAGLRIMPVNAFDHNRLHTSIGLPPAPWAPTQSRVIAEISMSDYGVLPHFLDACLTLRDNLWLFMRL